MTTQGGSKIAVFAAIAGNLVIALIKFIAAAVTGSSAMISEAFTRLSIPATVAWCSLD